MAAKVYEPFPGVAEVPPARGGMDEPKYPGFVSDEELQLMRIPARICHKANVEKGKRSKRSKSRKVAREWFCVRTTNNLHTIPELGFLTRLSNTPGALCPSPEEHLYNMTYYDLPLACPTCWSVQRNQKLTNCPSPLSSCAVAEDEHPIP